MEHMLTMIGPNKTHKLDWGLPPVKFLWSLFSSCRGEAENVAVNQRLGKQSWFSNLPEKHSWDLVSCQVKLKSVQWLHRRSWKCLSQSEAILIFWLAGKTQTRYRTSRSCFLSSFLEFRSAVTRNRILRSCFLLSFVKSDQWLQRRNRKCLSNQRLWRPSYFLISPKNTTLVEVIKILLPVKFC